ncbi:MAG: hypothetical protein V3T60_03900 [Candidatus Binatia bacterium]
MKGLSPKQKQVLEEILRSLRQRGMPPILDEISEAIGIYAGRQECGILL